MRIVIEYENGETRAEIGENDLSVDVVTYDHAERVTLSVTVNRDNVEELGELFQSLLASLGSSDSTN
ncbi:MAG TPA: hypothetical protein VGS96_11230 [Thermoanaerobaculia bacterium]|nr:hypothetical protein [Thermoanaerobaculia bacterium]